MHQSRWQWLIPVALGLFAFFLVIGYLPLIPSNIGWLDGGYDPTQHYLGWVFFRHHPWTLPIGLSPQYGLNISSAILYADSIPLLAVLFKAFSPYLAEPFQYFGIWFLLCFVLQASFAWACLGYATQNNYLRTFATALIVISPPMIWRMNMHEALAGHFLILAAIYFNLQPQQKYRILAWTILLCITSSVMLYLLAMIMALWVSNLLDTLWVRKKISYFSAALETGIVTIGVSLVLWQMGFFEVSALSSRTGDFGVYGFGLLSFFDSQGWSYILPSIPGGSLESFNYLGLGMLLLAGVALTKSTLAYQQIKNYSLAHPFFIAAIACLSVFAVTNTIRIASHTFIIPIPDALFSLASIFRGSARMIWPLYYLIGLGILFIVIRGFQSKKVYFLLLIAVALQVIDSSAGWWPIHRQFANTAQTKTLNSPLHDPFWAQAAKHYTNVINSNFPTGPPNLYIEWQIWANYAAENHLGTNSAWLSRYDTLKLTKAREQLDQMIRAGKYQQNSLYIISDEKRLPVLMHMDPTRDVFASIDGFNVLAPGWLDCKICLPVPEDRVIRLAIPQVIINKPIHFNNEMTNNIFLIGINNYQNLGWGWAFPESWGVWSEGPKAKVVLPIPLGNVRTLNFEVKAFLAPTHPTQSVEILVNGILEKNITISNADTTNIELNLPKSSDKDYVTIEFKLPNNISPTALGIGADIRRLGIGLLSATFH
ncbi:hypothetical protein MCEZE4_00484 [Burkholderiaceae bacterium]